jgi:hypothetical protein
MGAGASTNARGRINPRELEANVEEIKAEYLNFGKKIQGLNQHIKKGRAASTINSSLQDKFNQIDDALGQTGGFTQSLLMDPEPSGLGLSAEELNKESVEDIYKVIQTVISTQRGGQRKKKRAQKNTRRRRRT